MTTPEPRCIHHLHGHPIGAPRPGRLLDPSEPCTICAAYVAERTVETDGVLRWKSSGNVVPDDLLAGALVDEAIRARCREARQAEIAETVAAYRAAQEARSPEQAAQERAEARAAHGPGVRIVNVLTGETYIT